MGCFMICGYHLRDPLRYFRALFSSLFVFAFLLGIRSVSFAQQKVNWNGYLQYRFSDNYSDQAGFSIRRAKLWMDGQLPFGSDKWGFKLQSIFCNKQNFMFQLQDVFIDYKADRFAITAGQFVPDFSLQRKQPDYLIPLTERADVINALLPTAETMGRDIGAEVIYNFPFGGISIGLFNGNGANSVSDKKNFLYINRGFINLKNKSTDFRIGYSVAYRNDNELKFSKIFGNTDTFSGDDFRYGFDARLKLSKFEFQTEILEAYLKKRKAWGYYTLTHYSITPKNLIILSLEQLHDLNPSTIDDPWYTIGYSYKLKGSDIKFSFDDKFQFTTHKTYSLTTVQIQYFFNQ